MPIIMQARITAIKIEIILAWIAVPQKLNSHKDYFYAEKAEKAATKSSTKTAPTPAITGTYLGMTKTKTIHMSPIPSATTAA